MLDIIFIQHVDTGLNLVEYRQEHTVMKTEHSDIFTGFMSAIQNITEELNIGIIVLIATEGIKGHNCIIIPKLATVSLVASLIRLVTLIFR